MNNYTLRTCWVDDLNQLPPYVDSTWSSTTSLALDMFAVAVRRCLTTTGINKTHCTISTPFNSKWKPFSHYISVSVSTRGYSTCCIAATAPAGPCVLSLLGLFLSSVFLECDNAPMRAGGQIMSRSNALRSNNSILTAKWCMFSNLKSIWLLQWWPGRELIHCHRQQADVHCIDA